MDFQDENRRKNGLCDKSLMPVQQETQIMAWAAGGRSEVEFRRVVVDLTSKHDIDLTSEQRPKLLLQDRPPPPGLWVWLEEIISEKELPMGLHSWSWCVASFSVTPVGLQVHTWSYNPEFKINLVSVLLYFYIKMMVYFGAKCTVKHDTLPLVTPTGHKMMQLW